MKTFHFIERVGSKVIRVGTVPAPSMDGFPKMAADSVIELVDAPCQAALPACWDGASRRAVSLPARPSPAYEFDYDQMKWVADIGALWADVRSERDRRISACDWIMLPDVQLSDEKRVAWKAYRQALRDVTGQANPSDISWPQPPG